MQYNHVVIYESRKLKDQEMNFAINNLELASIIQALKMWFHYLIGRKFVLMIDHNGTKYLFDQPHLNEK